MAHHPLWASIKSRYYKNDGNIITTYSEYDDLGTIGERVLDNKITVISVPQSKKGLGIKPGSVLLTDLLTDTTYRDNEVGSSNSNTTIYNYIIRFSNW